MDYEAENSGISVLAFAHVMTQRKQHILWNHAEETWLEQSSFLGGK